MGRVLERPLPLVLGRLLTERLPGLPLQHVAGQHQLVLSLHVFKTGFK